MDLISFETELQFISEWSNYPLTEEEHEFLMEQASYMSDRDRAFYAKILQKFMGRVV